MHRRIVTLLCLFVAGLAGAQQPDYRFQALIDLDNNERSGCDVDGAAGTLSGSEVRVYALTDSARVQAVVMEACRQGVWEVERHDEPNRPIGQAEGEGGSDVIAWSVPRRWFSPYPRIEIRMLAEQLDSQAFDVIGSGADAVEMELDLIGNVLPIPALSLLSLVLLGVAAMLMGSQKLMSAPARPGVFLSVTLCLCMIGPSQPIASPFDPHITRVSATDPAYDTLEANAGVDLLRAEVEADAERIGFKIEVSDIDPDAVPAVTKVLFIGNSLTYYNDLPLIVKAIAAQAGKTLITDAITLPGVSLEDHYRQRTAHSALARGGYQVVILQQGPSSLMESQENLLEWTTRFNTLIRAGGARPALYMVWPELDRFGYFEAVRESYSNAALAVHGMFIPAGETWRTAWRSQPSLPLYSNDRFHPSPLGSYAAALTIYAELYRQSPVGLPATVQIGNGQTLQFNQAQARLVQEAAWATHLQFGRSGE